MTRIFDRSADPPTPGPRRPGASLADRGLVAEGLPADELVIRSLVALKPGRDDPREYSPDAPAGKAARG